MTGGYKGLTKIMDYPLNKNVTFWVTRGERGLRGVTGGLEKLGY